MSTETLHLTLQDLTDWRTRLHRHRPGLLKKRTDGHPGGQTRSRRQGRGMSFAETRAYQPGDEVRYIDWKITARTGRPHTKVFEETHEQPLILIVDQTPAQYFASQGQLKAALALHAAAILGWLACDRGEKIGGSIVGPDTTLWHPPQSGQPALMRFFHQLLAQHHQLSRPGSRLPARWQTVLETLSLPAGARLVLIGDLLALNEAVLKRLRRLARHHPITALHCADLLEHQLPDAGLLRLRKGEQGLTFDSHEPRLRQAYADCARNRLDALRHTLSDAGIPLILLMTHRDPLIQLIEQGGVQ